MNILVDRDENNWIDLRSEVLEKKRINSYELNNEFPQTTNCVDA